MKVVSKQVIVTEDDMPLSQLQSMMRARTVLSADDVPLSQLQATLHGQVKKCAKRKSSVTPTGGSKSKHACTSKTRIVSDIRRKTELAKRRCKSCCHCSFKCAGQGLLNAHLRCAHGMIPCGYAYCQSYWQSETAAKLHRSTHVFKKYVCQVCKKVFKHCHVCDCHAVTHKPPSHSCTQCDKAFMHPQDLKEHVLVHKKKTFRCSFCSRTFHSRKYVNMHE